MRGLHTKISCSELSAIQLTSCKTFTTLLMKLMHYDYQELVRKCLSNPPKFYCLNVITVQAVHIEPRSIFTGI